MLRRFYRCVLGLHPPAFRQRFAAEMLSIFDHAAAKPDAFRLLLDGFLSLARQWTLRPDFWHDIPPVAVQQPVSDSVPSFSTIDPFRPRTVAVVHGLVLSLAVFCVTCFAIKHSWIHILHVRIPEVEFESHPSLPPSASPTAFLGKPAVPRLPENVARVRPPAASRPAFRKAPTHAAPARAASVPTATPGQVAQPSATATSKSQQGSGAPPEPAPQDATSTMIPAMVKGVEVDSAERHRVIDGAIAKLKEYYVYADVAQKMSDALLAHEKSGDDNAQTDGEAFASLLTRQMRDVSHDKHLMLVYNRLKTPERPPGPTPEDLARYRKDMARNKCTIETAKILPHNIGYLKFNEFPDPAVCRSMIASAMNSLGHADAIIFDLRDNHGGDPKMVALIATYLFDHRTHLNDLYSRAENSTQQSWTLPPVPGNRLTDKPAYVLTSGTTFSGAEEFSYDLKNLKRATLVGETTAGGAHMVRRHRIDDHFMIAVPDTRPINPISKTDWEGTGVEPDVRVKAADALEAAEKLAEINLQKR